MTAMRKERNILLDRIKRLNKKHHKEGGEKEARHLKFIMSELNTSSECLHIVDGDSIILWANDTEIKSVGCKPDDYIGKSIIDFHIDRCVIDDILKKLLNHETIKNYPARLKGCDGKERHVLINSSGFWKSGEFSHTRCFSRDVTGFIDLKEKIRSNINKIKSKL